MEGGGCHAGGLEDVLVEVVLEFLAADLLHDVSGQGDAVVRVGGGGAGSEHLHRRVLQDVFVQVELPLLVAERPSASLLESGGVG